MDLLTKQMASGDSAIYWTQLIKFRNSTPPPTTDVYTHLYKTVTIGGNLL